MNRIIVGSREDAKHFHSDDTYAVISFVGHRHHRSTPRLPADRKRISRIIIRADDTYPDIAGTVPLSIRQAERIAKFLRHVAGKIDTLFIHCYFGHGRSCAAAIAIARAVGKPWGEFLQGERVGNGYITQLLSRALEAAGFPSASAAEETYDLLYANHIQNARRATDSSTYLGEEEG